MIDLRGITQIYQGPQGPVEALRGIDLHVTPGEVFGIIGRSGAGKSSLVRVINLLNRPSAGQVMVAGRDMTISGASVCCRCGMAAAEALLDVMPLPAARGAVRACP